MCGGTSFSLELLRNKSLHSRETTDHPRTCHIYPQWSCLLTSRSFSSLLQDRKFLRTNHSNLIKGNLTEVCALLVMVVVVVTVAPAGDDGSSIEWGEGVGGVKGERSAGARGARLKR